ncbi:methyl-accepting chemotaxis protein [Curvibacter sp. HBC61]|uniref:Methyl-accepting chemotaxis protein n=1 Tax=Curvibacter cyanobacteriorum TaxID=3026422 RepID=A0ABT5MW94_9BURK|nr:methyl-accepting chemotaxis protein [Curvibacter sp. HBC61]MDD0837052.1 methyl-accepting chemotaxis protein [Curvibacter sp. HBC61]
MQFLRNFKIGTRLGLGFGLMLLLLMLVGGAGMLEIRKVNANANELGTNWLPSIKALGEVRTAINEVRRVTLRHVLEDTPELKKSQMERHDRVLATRIPEAFASYEKLISSPEERQMWNTVKERWNAYVEIDKKVLSLSASGDAGEREARKISTTDAGRAFLSTDEALQKSIALNSDGAVQSTQQAAADYLRSVQMTMVLIGLALVVGAALAVVLTRSITSPIDEAVQVAETVAAGDLTSTIHIDGRDEAATLLLALQHMNDRLVDVVSQVRHSSDSIATGSAEIATGNADLSQRTESQASNLQQTAASMEELTSTVKTNADTAQQANRLATEASHAAEKGGEVVGQVVQTMQEISAASNKISDIIGTIDGIAFQTNILALNAAVEAARAGEQGRGFAVVASEVRSLAQRSAEAAKEIKTLIGGSVEKVEAGTRLVDEAGQSMTEIVTQVKRVGSLISEISNASHEQSSGIAQVGDAVNQLDQVTQQNAALVEESAAAADSLRNQAARLAEVVSAFKLAAGAGLTVAEPLRRPPMTASAPRPAPSAPKPKLSSAPAKTKAPALAAAPKPAASSAQAGAADDWESF